MTEPPVNPDQALGPRHWARVDGWGMAVRSFGYLFHPRTADEIRNVYDLARGAGKTIVLRGAGRSYGDAAINNEGIVLDLCGMDRVISWEPDTGIIELEPGVTIQKLWQTIIADGYWPPVVSGTMHTTMGGCAAMNVHGKNNFKVGPFGDHIIEFDLLLPSGEIRTCDRAGNARLFHAAVSGFGMLGCFIRLKMKMKKVCSGLLRIEAFHTRNLQEMVDEFEDRVADADYLVGWIDTVAGGSGLGRGIVHQANYLREGEDPRPADSLTISAQELPAHLFGIMPKSLIYLLMRPFINNPGVRLINASKYWSSRIALRGACYCQSHGAFAFLLDYVPNWKLAYGAGGLIQYQSFLPRGRAVAAFEAILRAAHSAGLPPYLGVFKKHRPDPFLLTHALDGYSLAMDFRVTASNRQRLWSLAGELDQIVLDNGGRFYFAKDATLQPWSIDKFLPPANIEAFLALKHECDPENILQSDLSKRLFGKRFSAEVTQQSL